MLHTIEILYNTCNTRSYNIDIDMSACSLIHSPLRFHDTISSFLLLSSFIIPCSFIRTSIDIQICANRQLYKCHFIIKSTFFHSFTPLNPLMFLLLSYDITPPLDQSYPFLPIFCNGIIHQKLRMHASYRHPSIPKAHIHNFI